MLLNRILEVHCVHILRNVGAAIENSMAEEIWHQLEDGTLSNAANLTNADQVASLCGWLCSL